MRGKRSKSAVSFYVLFVGVVLLIIIGYLSKLNVAVLNPTGTVARQERNLIFVVLGLCAIVVIPVFTLAILISLKYREGNKRPKKYSPDWDGNRWMEGTWWAVPFAIISILAVVTWNSSYNLDPQKALAANRPPLKVQVVSLDWKWLFIYPAQNVASVNWLEIPQGQPIEFDITSDTVMNSFWIPNLGSQIYSMPGMSTRLNLDSTKLGIYLGRSANISGSGFASMQFSVAVVSASDFSTWQASIKNKALPLNASSYRALAAPSQNAQPAFYSPVDQNLYNRIVNSYIGPLGRGHGGH